MRQRAVFLVIACLAPLAIHARAGDDAGALMTEFSQMVRQHSEKFVRCIDNTAARHAQNPASSPETAASASVEDCEGVLRVFIASCAQNIQTLCENFAKDMRQRELKRAGDLIARLRANKNTEK